jgi:predicted GNAT family N-acyltransferase
MIAYRRITTADPEYEAEKDLRNRVLRLPLGLALSEKDISGEEKQIHLVAADEAGKVVGCVLIVFPGDGTARIRQMAVDESLRGRGIGASLMRMAEEAARDNGVGKISMHARVYARSFYERLGYRSASEEFLEVTIPHITMEKALQVG